MKSEQLLDEELLKEIKGIQIKAKHLVNASFAGEYQSAFKGRGMEFDEVREYSIGDDIRNIDWNVTARAQAPFIKIFKDERELTVIFMVDISASNRFGSVKKLKNEIAAEITALLAYTALRNNDKVGLVIFSDKIEHYIPPKKGRGHVWQIIREILTFKSDSKRTNLNIPLEFIGKVIKHRAITFLISDFFAQDYETQLKTSAKHHDYIAISISDPREEIMPSCGYVELEDAETGESILVDTSNKFFQEQFQKLHVKNKKLEKKFFESSNIDYIAICNAEKYIGPLVAFFRQRQKKR